MVKYMYAKACSWYFLNLLFILFFNFITFKCHFNSFNKFVLLPSFELNQEARIMLEIKLI